MINMRVSTRPLIQGLHRAYAALKAFCKSLIRKQTVRDMLAEQMPYLETVETTLDLDGKTMVNSRGDPLPPVMIQRWRWPKKYGG